jgi:hypothetical protein
MSAIDIIVKKTSSEGIDIPREAVVKYILEKIVAGQVVVFEYGQVVFTVNIDESNPIVHMWGDESGLSILRCTRQFMRDVWRQVPHKYLLAPILNPGVQKLAQRMGWTKIGSYSITGHQIYKIERT